MGPQLCGKSKFVHALGEKVVEISIEDIPGLWESVSLENALKVWEGHSVAKVAELNQKDKFGVTLAQRLLALNGSEHMLLALMLSGKITAHDFKSRMAHHIADTASLDAFIQVALNVLAMKDHKFVSVFHC